MEVWRRRPETEFWRNWPERWANGNEERAGGLWNVRFLELAGSRSSSREEWVVVEGERRLYGPQQPAWGTDRLPKTCFGKKAILKGEVFGPREDLTEFGQSPLSATLQPASFAAFRFHPSAKQAEYMLQQPSFHKRPPPAKSGEILTWRKSAGSGISSEKATIYPNSVLVSAPPRPMAAPHISTLVF